MLTSAETLRLFSHEVTHFDGDDFDVAQRMADHNNKHCGKQLVATGGTFQAPDGSWVSASWVYDTKNVTYTGDEYAGGDVIIAFWGKPGPSCGDDSGWWCGSCAVCCPDLARRGII